MIQGQVAIVTGGSRGIGAAISRKLAGMGANVAVIYAGGKAAAEAVCEELAAVYGVTVRPYQCNVADYQQVKETVAAVKADFGTVNILVNNAGITRDKLLAMMDEEAWDAVLDTNLKGAFNMIRHCTGIFIRAKGGVIVNVGSVSGLMGNPGQANYAASKAGLVGMTKTVAKELAPRGVRCNLVAPGFIQTEMTDQLGDHAEALLKAIPLGAVGRPEDVADAVAYLVTAPYVTGATLQVDGGIGM